MYGNIPCGLMIAAAQGVYKHIDFRHDIIGHFLVQQIPGGAGGPGGVFVVPIPFATFKIIISKPGNTGRKFLRFLDFVFGFFSKGDIHGYSPVK